MGHEQNIVNSAGTEIKSKHWMSIERMSLLVFFVLLFVLGFSSHIDPDLWWHLKIGAANLEKGFQYQDQFSLMFAGQKILYHEWLTEAMMAWLFNLGGFPGLTLIFALVAAFAFGLVYRVSSGKPYLAMLLVLLAVEASRFALGPRPHLVTLFMLALYLNLIEDIRKKKKSLIWLSIFPLLTMIWANLHAGFLMGIALLVIYALGDGLEIILFGSNSRGFSGKEIGWLAVTAVASALMTIVNPYGWELWSLPFRITSSSSTSVNIVEWMAANFQSAECWAFGVLLGVGGFGFMLDQRRASLPDVVLFLGSAALGLVSMRHIPIFAVVATPVISRTLSHVLQQTQFYDFFNRKITFSAWSIWGSLLGWLLVSATLFFGLEKVKAEINELPADIYYRYPAQAVNYLIENGLDKKRGFNEYGWGGYLIWRGIPVLVDGRSDGLYEKKFLSDYFEIRRLNASWESLLSDLRIDYVMVKVGKPLGTLLAASSDWREVYRDHVAIIFVPSESRQKRKT
ncbi:MAG: hypothetical protein PHN49_11350 [Candidatus Omnitrophica bacterium]|nr:hypothetical protein [Candidatus Omnitrophota bacterium]